MLTVKFNANAERSRLNTIKSEIAASRPDTLNQIGSRLQGLARIYFDQLSRGGAGFTGRTWRSPKPSTVKRRLSLARQGRLAASPDVQGIVSGALRESLRYDVNGNRVSLRYDDPKAAYFNAWRRLIPTVLPRPWRKACDEIVQSKLDSISRSE